MSLPRPKSTGFTAVREMQRRQRDELARLRSATGTLNYGSVDVARVLTPVGVKPSEPPPMPSGVTVEAAEESVTVVWSGSAQAEIPVDYQRVAVHMSVVSGFFPTEGTEVAAFPSPNGGIASIAAAAGVTQYVRTAMVTLKGRVSDFTFEIAVTPTEPAAPSSDGFPPASSPTPTALSGIGALFARWAAIENADPVSYDVHVSTASGFTPGPATLSQTTAGTFATVRTLPDGTALAYGVTYFMKIVAFDADGAAAASAESSAQIVKIETVDIQAGAVVTGSIGDNAVDTSKLADGSVSAAKIIDGSVGSAEIAADAVTSTEIADDAVTTPKIVANAVTAAEIAANTITASQIAASAIGADELAANSVVAGKIAAAAVTTTELAAGAVTADKIAADTITSNEISAAYAYLGQIVVDQLIGGTLSSDVLLSGEIKTADSGARVRIGPFGIEVYDSAGELTIILPTNGVSTFKGIVEAAALVASGMSLRGTMNEISTAAALQLSQGVAPPQSAPSAVADWDYVTFAVIGGHGLVLHGGTWHTVHDTATPQINSFPLAGGASTFGPDLGDADSPRPWGGLTRIGTSWYTLGLISGSSTYFITKYSDTGVEQAQVLYTPLDGPNGSGGSVSQGIAPAAIGTNGTDVLIAEFDEANSRYRIQARDATTLAVSSTLNTASHPNFTGAVSGVLRGFFDFGADRYVIATRGGPDLLVFTTTGVLQGNDGFPAPTAGIQAAAWDGSLFHTGKQASSDYRVYEHTGINWTSESSLWWAAFTWRDNDAGGTGTHETSQSVKASFTMRKRARLTLGTPDIPDQGGADDPSSVRFYVGRGASEPARTSMWLNGSPATGVTSHTLTTVTFSGTNPPSASDFPASTPALIKSEGLNVGGLPMFEVDGDGAGRFGDLQVDDTGEVTFADDIAETAIGTAVNWSSQATVTRLGRWVTVHGEWTRTGGATTGSFAFGTLGVGFRPAQTEVVAGRISASPSGIQTAFAVIGTDGSIVTDSVGVNSGATYRFRITYPAGA